MDYIGKYERINDDWSNLCKFLFKIPPSKLMHLEKWKSKDKPKMTDRLRQTTLEMYADDYKVLYDPDV